MVATSSIPGGCHCGAVRYEVKGETLTHALCHCRDCRRSAGAPMVGWTMYRAEAVKVTKGVPKVYGPHSPDDAVFCCNCVAIQIRESVA